MIFVFSVSFVFLYLQDQILYQWQKLYWWKTEHKKNKIYLDVNFIKLKQKSDWTKRVLLVNPVA